MTERDPYAVTEVGRLAEQDCGCIMGESEHREGGLVVFTIGCAEHQAEFDALMSKSQDVSLAGTVLGEGTRLRARFQDFGVAVKDAARNIVGRLANLSERF